jgi:hypothetical protein
VPQSGKLANLPDAVIRALAADGRIESVELTGSRAAGRATALSDWDFAVTTGSFDEVRQALPETVATLRPVVAQWDRLSRAWCYMLILAGPAKVDLIFSYPHRPLPPWQVTPATLPGIDDHFWDWALWLGSKQAAGRADIVAGELDRLHRHLLGPMGVPEPPAGLGQAVAGYRGARAAWEARLETPVSRAAEQAVLPALPA